MLDLYHKIRLECLHSDAGLLGNTISATIMYQRMDGPSSIYRGHVGISVLTNRESHN